MKKRKIFSILVGLVVASMTIVNCNINLRANATSKTEEEKEFCLKADKTKDENGDDCVQLDWDNLNKVDQETKEGYEYMVCSKKNGEEEFQTIPTKSSVNVLNIYPDVGNNLKKWMNEPAIKKSTNEENYDVEMKIPYSQLENGVLKVKSKMVKYNYIKDENGNFITNGRGILKKSVDKDGKSVPSKEFEKENLIKVDERSIGDISKCFEENEDIDIFCDEKGKTYDVVYQGGWDSNNYKYLPEKLREKLREYISSGGGYLAGHDTAYYGPLAKDMKIDGADQNQWTGAAAVKINKKGLLTRYPWNICEIGDILEVPMSHCGQFAAGDVWFKYNENTWNHKGKEINDEIKGTNNFYLTTYKNTAMIQTGHSGGTASPDEQKILANTLFYLSQITTDTSIIDHKCSDYDAPTKPEINSISVGDNVDISFSKSVDPKTLYQYYVKARKLGTQEYDLKSNTVEVDMTSKLRGYLLYTDNDENSKVNKVLQEKIEKIMDGREVDSKFNTIRNKFENSLNTSLESKLKMLDNSDLELLGFKVIADDDYTGSASIDKINNNFYAHVAAVDNAGNISETSTQKYEYINILNIEPESEIVSKDNEVWIDLTLNNISESNTTFAIRKVKDIVSQKITIKYDNTKLKYKGACTFSREFRILDENDDNGEITFNLICKNTDDFCEKIKMLALSFEALESGESDVEISSGIIKDVNDTDISILPVQLGRCSIKVQ